MTKTSRVRGLIIVYGLLTCLLLTGVAWAQDLGEDFAEGVKLFQDRAYEAAASKLEDVTDASPENAAAWYYLGVARYRIGDLEEALDALQEAQELRPGRPGTSLHIGLIYERLGAWDEAMRAYQDELRNRQFRNLAEVHNALGRAYFYAGRDNDAIEATTEALRHNEKFVEALYHRARAHHERGEYEAAIEDFQEAIDICDEWDRKQRQLDRLVQREGEGGLTVSVRRERQGLQEELARDYARAAEFVQQKMMRPYLYIHMGDAADANQEWSAARIAYRKALDPDKGGNAADPLPHTRVGFAYLNEAMNTFQQHGQLFITISAVDEAIRNFDEALNINIEYAPAHKGLGDTFRFQAKTYVSDPERKIVSHSFEDAIARYDDAIAYDPQFVDAYLGRAQAKLQLEDADGAIEDLRTALSMAPRRAELYAALATANMMNEDYRRAIDAAQTALGLEEESAQAHNAAGLAYYYLGELGLASEHFTDAIEADPTQHQSYTNLGNTFFQLGSWHRARINYEKALERIPTATVANTAVQRSYLYYLIGRTHHFSGQYEREVEALNNALGLDSAYLDALTQLATAHIALEEYEAARQALESALSVSPGPEEDAQIYVQMGRLYEAEGKPYEAITAYGAAVAAQTDNIEAREALKRLTSG